ncbi:alpha-glucan family phosphorylase [Tenuifilum thalassicum]|uniref:Alpha-glucan family phosphorylase n=1 Tax=Tenuifilum thalassicum TaxID=2590900 RepID=A0A7D4BJ53_9BACT|nr:alpha-glucan family phosphorylase [Tenuifilum thalassicum]QKG79279.1 alpha-glucan family phosphorylase [Tenuifilum thalassicum]
MTDKLLKPDYLFEVSWEVCNKVGGIHTVVSTKASLLENELKNNYITIGPDIIKDSENNLEFIEDQELFKAWKIHANSQGLAIRIGRWNIPCKPIAILVNFSGLISKKDEIFKILWEKFKLDSLTGQWDYIEPALFGYAAGKVIESFTNFNLSLRHRVVAQFHEWMTGTGLLYLKDNMPQVGTVFTTHATVLGRSIAGNNLPLYSNIDKYSPEHKAKEFNVVAKHSLESIAAREADCFTTVSEITAQECKHFLGKEVDLITPNGFDDSFIPTPDEEFKLRHLEGRIKFYEVAEAMLSHDVAKDSIVVGISGRYEFKNKGIDVFLEALAKLNKENNLKKEILAFLLIPAGHHGPRKDVFHNLRDAKETDSYIILDDTHVTHYLNDPESEIILKKIRSLGLNNASSDKVKVFWVPCYLNGNDGIFNKPYYDLLIGMDLTVFPSYYEPWGYTPLESLAFKVPTITTSLAGFGDWINKHYNKSKDAIRVIHRTDSNDNEVINHIAETLYNYTTLSQEEKDNLSTNAGEISRVALWENFVNFYFKAYDSALRVVAERTQMYMELEREEVLPTVEHKIRHYRPNWVRLIIQKRLPEKLKPLDEISRNLWWSWNTDAKELFESIDKELWDKCEHNPIEFLEKISLPKFQELEKDEAFVEKLQSVYLKFSSYMMKKYERKGPKIAYFSMEFGLHSSLKLYSGGLGVLAGDYLKEASDRNIDMVGVGLLYRYGYFTQKLSASGQQIAVYDQQNFTQSVATPVRDENGKWITVKVAFPGRDVFSRIWKVEVGRTDLYLLDTDMEENQPIDRTITHHLYGGDLENRFKQEMILGIAGIRALNELGINADIYHINEGHAAFIGLERLRKFIVDEKLSFNESLELVRASSLFTTHTPVPAGHDAFPEELVRTYMAHYPERLKITWDEFMDLGRLTPGDKTERFSMSHLAIRLSQEVNGVSWLHGEVSRKMFAGMWPCYFPNELHISYVTNGVHFPTWTAREWKAILEDVDNNNNLGYNQPNWSNIQNIPDNKIWDIRNKLRKRLIKLINKRLSNPNLVRYETPRQVIEIKERLSDKVLTIGFARRFATYKRAWLLFKDTDRLAELVNNPERPVQIFFAGKAHPHDKAGQDIIKRIIEISKEPRFLGRIVFLQNYDMELARRMVQGVDVWLNTPTRPMEASGTSGQKAVMNGVLHFSVLDGWWVEGYRENAGWALPIEQTYPQQEFQDELDAELIYTTLENEIVPAFYERNTEDIPTKWISFIKKSMSDVASNFTTLRMINDYQNRFYNKLYHRYNELAEDDFEQAKQISQWKRRIARNWDEVEVIRVKQLDMSREPILIGNEYEAEVVLDLGTLAPDEIGVELVVVDMIENQDITVKRVHEFELAEIDGSRVTYKLKLIPMEPGAFECGIRIFPKNPILPHRMDFCLVRWI